MSLINIRISKQKFFNWGIYMCALLACLVPRYQHTFKLSVGLDFSLYTILVFLFWFLFVRKFYKLGSRIENYIYYVWLFFIVASVWRAEKIGVWGYYVILLLVCILFQQIIYWRMSSETFDMIISALVDGLALHLLMGMYEITTHRYLFETGNIATRLYGNVPIGMFMNLNDYATFVATVFPFSLYKLLNTNNKLKKFYYGLLLVTSVFMLIKSESRAVLMVLASLIGVLVYLFGKKSFRNKMIVVASILLTVLIFIFNSVLLQDLGIYFMNTMIGSAERSNYVRINLIKNGLYFLSETYGFGVGAGNLYEWLGEKSIYYIEGVRFIHNWYVEVLVTFGVVFFILYMLFHMKIFFGLYKNINKEKVWDRHNTIFTSFLAFSIVCISSSSNMYSEWVWMYFVFVSSYCLFIYKKNDSGVNIISADSNIR